MKRILLSASFPIEGREDAREHSAQDIGLATGAIVETALVRGYHVVFGGHPSISPIVLNLAHLIQDDAGVTVFQSHFFEDSITHEVRRLQDVEAVDVVWTDVVNGKDQKPSLIESVKEMRRRMLSVAYSAAFFVGGMAGIKTEFQLLGERQACDRFLVVEPGGYAEQVAAELRPGIPDDQTPTLEALTPHAFALHGRGYARLASLALDVIA